MGEKVEKKKILRIGGRASQRIGQLKVQRSYGTEGSIFSLAFWYGWQQKRLQAFVQHVLETMHIPAPWLARLCKGRQRLSADISEAHCHWATATRTAEQRGALISCSWLLAVTTEKWQHSSGSGIDPHSSPHSSWDKFSSDKCVVAIILWGQRRACCYLHECIDESRAHLLRLFQGGRKRIGQMLLNFFQTLGNASRQLPLNTCTKSDQELYRTPIAFCLCIWSIILGS